MVAWFRAEGERAQRGDSVPEADSGLRGHLGEGDFDARAVTAAGNHGGDLCFRGGEL